jgi:hypothetical protein
MQFLGAQPQLIVCGRLGIQALTDTRRREMLSSGDRFDALEPVARLQGRWDVAYTTTQRPDLVEADFLANGAGEASRRARKRVLTHRDLLVSPRATAQLQREIIEYASAAEAAPTIDVNTLVHMLLSITSEQNARPEFGEAGCQPATRRPAGQRPGPRRRPCRTVPASWAARRRRRRRRGGRCRPVEHAVVHDPVAEDGEAAPDPLGVGRLDVVPAGEVERDPVVGEAAQCVGRARPRCCRPAGRRRGPG